MKRNAFTILFMIFLMSTNLSRAQDNFSKPRTIITTDGEIDDVDSFIRMLLYANELQIEGLVISSSMWHWKGDGKGTTFISEMEMTKEMYGERTNLRWVGTEWMFPLLDAYDKVYPKLSENAEGYPTAEYLKSIVKVGNIDFEGEMSKDTEGSDFIKSILLNNNNEPIYLQAWGGNNTIARALFSIEEEFSDSPSWQKIHKSVSEKTIIYNILDQDITLEKYISKKWPNIKILNNLNQFWSVAYNWKKEVPKDFHPFLEGDFMDEHIINNHGPLTKMYYAYGDGQKLEGDETHTHGDTTKMKNTFWGDFEKYDFISEGDSPAFLHLIEVGLDNLKNPSNGGWGGRLEQSKIHPNRWEDNNKVFDYNPYTKKLDLAYPQSRWMKALQLDFAARADWCIKNYADANHPPEVKIEQGNQLIVPSGKTIKLKSLASDPDGDKITYKWWQYLEPGTYSGLVKISKPNKSKTKITFGEDLKKGETVHVILEVTDSQFPNLTRYQRVILTGE
ncbi:DUF1593 domain-containing protein [Aurantibacter crassamenti]|uniref:DUF1593 domain-containing protein n=1 Tax=Aurantibacter crassamenti TaxID=1837375 RepID=UPI001939B830|nr:DUF1593 domain-containing protein [Aurantibacter crassamenti]MBM1107775.1 DUF1593 domain-containing protein [Aurantibacter crassamenti]